MPDETINTRPLADEHPEKYSQPITKIKLNTNLVITKPGEVFFLRIETEPSNKLCLNVTVTATSDISKIMKVVSVYHGPEPSWDDPHEDDWRPMLVYLKATKFGRATLRVQYEDPKDHSIVKTFCNVYSCPNPEEIQYQDLESTFKMQLLYGSKTDTTDHFKFTKQYMDKFGVTYDLYRFHFPLLPVNQTIIADYNFKKYVPPADPREFDDGQSTITDGSIEYTYNTSNIQDFYTKFKKELAKKISDTQTYLNNLKTLDTVVSSPDKLNQYFEEEPKVSPNIPSNNDPDAKPKVIKSGDVV